MRYLICASLNVHVPVNIFWFTINYLKKLTLILFLLITKHYHKLVNDLPVAVGADVLVYDFFFIKLIMMHQIGLVIISDNCT